MARSQDSGQEQYQEDAGLRMMIRDMAREAGSQDVIRTVSGRRYVKDDGQGQSQDGKDRRMAIKDSVGMTLH